MTPEPEGVSACFPAYNDAETIAWVVRRSARVLAAAGVPHEILVLDDGSGDRTGEVLDSLREEIPVFRPLRHEQNRGYGAALRGLFAAAREDWIFYTDGDGQFDPADLAQLLPLRAPGVALVNGFRDRRADPALRRALGPGFHRVVAATFDLPPLRDWDCDFRLFRRAALPPEAMTFADGTAVIEMLRALGTAGSAVEAGVGHRERPAGRSEYFRVRRIVRGHRNLLRLRRRIGAPPIRWRACFGG